MVKELIYLVQEILMSDNIKTENPMVKELIFGQTVRSTMENFNLE